MRYSILLTVGLLIAACTTQERLPSEFVTAGSDLSATTPNAAPASKLNDGSPLYKQSEEFDRWLQSTPLASGGGQLKEECHSHSENPYCALIPKSKTLLQIRDERRHVRTPIEIHPVVPSKVDIRDGKIQNWTELRNAQIPQLLKGLLASSPQELTILKTQALKEKRCPNGAAIALAATLEDGLPSDVDAKEIAALYMQGARCARKAPVDNEHFFTRAALLYITQNQWKKANEILMKVRPTDAFSGRATYWLYRSFQALGEKQKAQKAYARLVKIHPFSFHALLAWKENNFDPGQEILGDKAFEKRSKRKPKSNQLLYAVETLKKYGFDYSAALVVDLFLETPHLEPQVRAYAASLGDPRTKINTASEFLMRRNSGLSRGILELAYPKAFFPLFMHYGTDSISPYLAMSIARRESSFDPRAISPANAQGMLQLNPDTSLKLTGGKVVDLFDPSINIELGTRYLADLAHHQFSNVYMAVAAYNAGEQSAGVWLKRYPKADPILFIDLIPYRETRDYVANVLTNFYWYRRIYEGVAATHDLVP